jgi:hypothetical protein
MHGSEDALIGPPGGDAAFHKDGATIVAQDNIINQYISM